MRNRQMQDSQSAFELCIIGIVSVLVALLLTSIVITAIDKEMAIDQAQLDKEISPAQRAEVMRR